MTYLEKVKEVERLERRILEVKPTYLEKLEHYKELILPNIKDSLDEIKKLLNCDFEIYLSQYIDPYEDDWLGGVVELVFRINNVSKDKLDCEMVTDFIDSKVSFSETVGGDTNVLIISNLRLHIQHRVKVIYVTRSSM